MVKVECWNCGIYYRIPLLKDYCPNCKIRFVDEWKYTVDWKHWARDFEKKVLTNVSNDLLLKEIAERIARDDKHWVPNKGGCKK